MWNCKHAEERCCDVMSMNYDIKNSDVLIEQQRRLGTRVDIKDDKTVGDWISAPSPNFVAVATRIGPKTFCMVPLNRPSPKTPWLTQAYPVYLLYKPTYRQFCANFGELILGFRGLNQKSKKTVL